MQHFQTYIGLHHRVVDVVFWIEEGHFDGFYVLIPHLQEDITGYLDRSTLNDLEYQAQRHYLEQTVNKNEQEIINGN